MITLKTGVPGASKTLSAVHEMAVLLGRQIKGKEETRPIFVHGVKDLSLPHFPLPDATKWADCPEGSIVIIDEAQGTFPPRSSTSKPPPHVEALNTHRHKGIDLIVITQHPKLIDQAVRRLVGKHQHYRRLYGGKTSVCYEWDHCEDSLMGIKNAHKSMFRQPRDAFKYYTSAEVHTKQSFKVPLWLIAFPLAVVALAIHGGPTVARILSGKPSEAATAPASASSTPSATALGTHAVTQHLADVAQVPALRIVGCIALKARCECIDSTGVSAVVEYDRCMASSARGGLLVPYGAGEGSPMLSTPGSGAASTSPRPMASQAIGISTGYTPRNPVRDTSTTLAASGSYLDAPPSGDGEVLAWMRRR
jgi:zona occludens toxin